MRCPGLQVLSLALLAAPLAAQGFEGKLTMKVNGDQPLVLDWTIKGNMSMAKLTIDNAQTGPMDITMIIDNTAQTSTMMMPVPAALAQLAQGMNIIGLKIVTDMKAPPPPPAGPPDAPPPPPPPPPPAPPRKLTTSQTIAGLRCDDYELSDSLKTRACFTTALGRFVFPGLGGGGPGRGGGRRGGRGAAAGGGAGGGGGFAMGGLGGGLLGALPAWTGELGGIGFPLKVWTPDGKVSMEVTDIVKTAVSADVFAIPEGYQDVNALGAMFGGGRGGAGGAGGGGGGGGGRGGGGGGSF